jgi:hypothetical protein
MKGNFKFGLRIFIIFPIHPMKLGATMLNSFLFNVGLILLTSLATVQFCTNAFAELRAVCAGERRSLASRFSACATSSTFGTFTQSALCSLQCLHSSIYSRARQSDA